MQVTRFANVWIWINPIRGFSFMKHTFTQILTYAKKLIPFFLSALLLVLLLKQLALYPWMTSIFQSMMPVFGGVLIALFLQPFIDKLEKYVSAKIAVFIVYTFIIVSLILFVICLIPLLYHQMVDFMEVLPNWVEKVEQFLEKYHIVYGNMEDFKNKYVQEGYVVVIDSLKTTMNTFTDYGIAFFTAFFLSLDLDYWKRSAKKLFTDYQRYSNFYHTMSNIVYQYLVGTILDLFFIMISVGITLYFFDFPNAFLYAIILAFLNLFPYVGATLGLILIAIVAALSYPVFPWLAFAIVWSIQQLESNIIQPLIFNHTMNVRPILSFVFIFIGEALFGVIGVILSPIFASIAQIAIRSYLHAKTSDRVGEWDDIWQDFDEAMKQEEKEGRMERKSL